MPLVFHGSPLKCFETVEPRRNVRTCEENGAERIIFDDISFHATCYRWIALAYTYHRVSWEHHGAQGEYSMGISLYENTHEVAIFGVRSLEESLERLYSQGGYLYVFSSARFYHAEGLGPLEVITQDHLQPERIEWIKDPVQALRDEGVTFTFIDLTLQKLNAR